MELTPASLGANAGQIGLVYYDGRPGRNDQINNLAGLNNHISLWMDETISVDAKPWIF
jgi:hypothetical protein